MHLLMMSEPLLAELTGLSDEPLAATVQIEKTSIKIMNEVHKAFKQHGE